MHVNPAMKIPEKLCTAAEQEMAKLRTNITLGDTALKLYNAGMMHDKVRFGLFARDLLTTALVLQDAEFLKETIRFALLTLGRRCDPLTGEEPGRVIHEFNEVEMRGLKTRYNAAETSQLLLIASADYLRITGDTHFVEDREEGLKAAVSYVLSHIRGGLFWEDPANCGASRYALRATYWKDSRLPGRVDLAYPIAYALVHAQTAAALRAAVELIESVDLGLSPARLEEEASAMGQALLSELWDEDLCYPLIARDEDGPIGGISSDGLHMLAYLRPGDIPQQKLKDICSTSRALETPYGFRTYAPGQPDYSETAYHLGAIWPFEQFFIAKGAIIHGQEKLLKVALKIATALEKLGFPELFYWDEQSGLVGPGAVPGEGCDLQLWTAACPQGMHRLLIDTPDERDRMIDRWRR